MPATSTSIINAADAEWNYWGRCTWNCITGKKSSGFHIDDEDPYAQYVIDKYCALFFKKPIKWPTIATIGDDDYYWSAVTISYIMRQAGFLPAEFPIGQAHATYVTWSVDAKKKKKTTAAYWGYRIDDLAALPDVGDLVGYARGKGMTKAKALKFYDKTGSYSSHTDIVVAKRPGEIDVIGGNVRDSVCKKTLALSGTGHLADTTHNWFVVMKKR